jgi:hypothetical protein
MSKKIIHSEEFKKGMARSLQRFEETMKMREQERKKNKKYNLANCK